MAKDERPPRAPRSRKDNPAPPPRNEGRAPREPAGNLERFRDRLKQDRFLFGLCLMFLAFTTWALAVSWRLLGDPFLLALTVLSIPPAFYLFYLRDSPA